MVKSALGRRRGVTSSTSGRSSGRSTTTLLISLVMAMVATALLLGIVVGTQFWLHHPLASSSNNNNNNSNNSNNNSNKIPVSPESLDRAQLRGGADKAGSLQELQRLHQQQQQQLPPKVIPNISDANKKKADDGAAAAASKDDFGASKDHGDDVAGVAAIHGPGDLVERPEFPAKYLGSMVATDHDFSTWKAPGGSRFAEYVHGDSPYRITPELRQQSDQIARTRRYHVQRAMKFAWDGYAKYAFGMDEIHPQSRQGNNNWGGMGNTLVDSLDTLWLMGLKEEFFAARDWVRDHLQYEYSGMVSVFETTIRSLGGLLSAYDWSGDVAFLDKAKDLGARLFKAFATPSGIPYGQVNLKNGHATNIGWTGNNAILAEFGTLQLEFRYLAKLSGVPQYATTSERVFSLLKDMAPANGLYPNFISNMGSKPSYGNSKYTFGAMSDSVYEYMLKIWIQGGKTESLYRDMYDKAIQGMHEELLQTSTPSGLTYIADKNGGYMDHKMDHLVCFMGGLLALGAYTDPLGLDGPRAQRDLKTAKALTYTCYQMYARMPTGISPEYIQFYANRDFDVGPGAPHYLLRPEAVEAFFYLHQLTGDPIYREWGWEVFSSIERYCKANVGYGQLRNVQDVNPTPDDKMESFFLAETLKYLYLLLDPDTPVDILHKHVFNTEAHPFRIFPLIGDPVPMGGGGSQPE